MSFLRHACRSRRCRSTRGWDHTGVPIHFHSSTTSGSACLIKARRRESIFPRQSPSSWILASISGDADSTLWEPLSFTMSACFPCELLFFVGFLAFSAMFYKRRPCLQARKHRHHRDEVSIQSRLSKVAIAAAVGMRTARAWTKNGRISYRFPRLRIGRLWVASSELLCRTAWRTPRSAAASRTSSPRHQRCGRWEFR
jgi:hypothetical protein